MKQTFVVDINYNDQYRIICDWVNETQELQGYITKEVLLLKNQRANVGDTVYLRCLHYWYKGIIAMGMLFDCTPDNVGLHLKNIFKSGELVKESVTEKISATASDGKKYMTQFYNLDAIISVGCSSTSEAAKPSALSNL